MTSGIRGNSDPLFVVPMAGASNLNQLKEQIETHQSTVMASLQKFRSKQEHMEARQDQLEGKMVAMQSSLETFSVNLVEQFAANRRLLGCPQEGDTGGNQTEPKAKEVLRLPPLPKCAPAAKTPDPSMESGSESLDEGVRSSEQIFDLLKPSNECDAVITEQSPVVQAEPIASLAVF